MVQSRAASVDDWLAEVDPGRAPALARIRDAARRNFPDWVESMRYGMPSYGPAGRDPVFAFNSQKRYIALYVPSAVHRLHAAALQGLDTGKSCIRFRGAEQIDFDLLDRLLADTARQDRAC